MFGYVFSLHSENLAVLSYCETALSTLHGTCVPLPVFFSEHVLEPVSHWSGFLQVTSDTAQRA